MERRHLRGIITVSYIKSEYTNFEDLRAGRKWGPLIRSLKGDECVLLVATMQNQLMFLKGYVEVAEGTKRWRVLPSSRIRVLRGNGLNNTWEPKMLANYAKSVGIELVGIKLLEEHYAYLLEEKERKKKERAA